MDEPALADTGRAEHGHQDVALLDHRALERGTQDAELAVAADHRTADASMEPFRSLVHGDEAPDCDSVLVALDRDVARLAGDDGAPTSRHVESPTSVSPGSAACWRAGGHVHGITGRAAAAGSRVADHDRAGVDADAHRDLDPAPVRRAVLSAASAVVISAAARTALSPSSSCTTGTPKTATTASPMNFSTEPPWRSRTLLMASTSGPSSAAPRDRGARPGWSSR